MRNCGVLATAAAVAVAVLLLWADQAAAQDYPYCAMRGGRGASENCGYATLAQCRATVSGAGGFCQVNPRFFAAYGPVDESAPRRRRARAYRE